MTLRCAHGGSWDSSATPSRCDGLRERPRSFACTRSLPAGSSKYRRSARRRHVAADSGNSDHPGASSDRRGPDGRSLILHGKPGRGKTHIAVAIGYRAIQNGFDTLFVTAAELIEDLSVASRDGRIAKALARYVTPHVLVCDEVGYLTYGPDAANVCCASRRR